MIRLRPCVLNVCAPLLLSLAGLPAAAATHQSTISDIRVTGAERVGKDAVLAKILLHTGEAYDAGKADRSVHDLFATGEFKDVKITRNGTSLLVTVAENPLVAGLKFSGNSEVKTDKLQAAVKLKTGVPYSDAKAHADALALRALYRQDGRMSTSVEPKTTALPGNKVDVTFQISEGKVDKVSSITFEGNKAFTASELEGVILTTRSSWLDILKSSSTYVAEKLDADRDLIRQHYLNHGYADAKVTAAEAALDADGKGYAVKFVVDEGPRYTFGRVAIETRIDGLETSGLDAELLIHPGDVYNSDKIARSIEALSLALWNKGAKFARVGLKPQRDEARQIWSVAFVVEKGPHVTIARIEISGNVKTQEHVIRRVMKLTEGEAFNALMLSRDAARIKALGYFKSVKTDVKKSSDRDTVDVVVDVVEDQTLELSVGAGYSSSEGVIGDIAIEDHNLFGTGRWMKVKLAGSAVKLQAEAGFTEPHLLGSDFSGGFDLFYRDYDASKQSSYKGRKIGGDVRAGYDFSDTVSGSVNYTFTQNKLYDVGADASAAIKEAVGGAGATSNTYYTSSVGYALAYDTRNAKKLPNSGTFIQLSQDFAGVGGDVRYVKSTIDARTYYPISSSATLVGRSTAGNITGWGGQDVRLLDMFFLGSEGVRGFAASGIGPRDTSSFNKDALGGTSYVTTSAEARFGLPLVPDDIGLKAAIFADAGSLFGSSASVSKTAGVVGTTASLRASAGVGLIWDSPIGPLRADYAFPLVKQPFDKTQPWSFGIASF